MNKDKLLSRARNLYAMSLDPSSPNESAIAARRARALMDQFCQYQSLLFCKLGIEYIRDTRIIEK